MEAIQPIQDSELGNDAGTGDQAVDWVAAGTDCTRLGTTHTANQRLGGAGTNQEIKKAVFSWNTEQLEESALARGARVRFRITALQQLIPTDAGAGLVQHVYLVEAPVGYAGGHQLSDYPLVLAPVVGNIFSDYEPALSSLGADTYLTFVLNQAALVALQAAQDAGECFSLAVVLYGHANGGIGPGYVDKEDYLTLASMDHATSPYRPQLQVCAGVFFRGYAAAANTHVAYPAAAQAGDLAVLHVSSDSALSGISDGTWPLEGWTSLGQLRGKDYAAYKILDADDLAAGTGTWLQVTRIQVGVYGGASPTSPNGKASNVYDQNTAILTPLTVADGSSWIVWMGESESDASYKSKKPSGYTSRSSSGAVGRVSTADTNGGVATQGAINTLAGGGTQYMRVLEVLAGCPVDPPPADTAPPTDGRWQGSFQLPESGGIVQPLTNLPLRSPLI